MKSLKKTIHVGRKCICRGDAVNNIVQEICAKYDYRVFLMTFWGQIGKAQPISRFHGRDADREMDGFP